MFDGQTLLLMYLLYPIEEILSLRLRTTGASDSQNRVSAVGLKLAFSTAFPLRKL